MELLGLGSTGRTGRLVVTVALARGHRVRALARSAQRAGALLPDDPALEVVEGDLLDAASLERAVKGADAAVNAAGPVKGGPPDLQERGIGNLLAAMTSAGVGRLVTLTGAGVRDPGDQPKVADRVIRGALKLLQGRLLADSEAYVAAVRASDLDWTVVRAPRLTDADRRGSYRTSPVVSAETGTRIARGDLADFLLDEVEQGAHVGSMPVVSW
jgi:putative NADH-flavin reductase